MTDKPKTSRLRRVRNFNPKGKTMELWPPERLRLGLRVQRWIWCHVTRPILWLLDPETAHAVTMFILPLYGRVITVMDYISRIVSLVVCRVIKRPLRYYGLLALRDLRDRHKVFPCN